MDRSRAGTLIVPPPLAVGSRVAIVSPSGRIDRRLVEAAASFFAGRGFDVRVGRYACGECGAYSGTVSERLADIQEAFDDRDTRLVFCSRGGYGAVQLLDKIDFTRFLRSPKWVAGFSDVTALHAAVQRAGCLSLHAPMAKHIAECGCDAEVARMLDVLSGKHEGLDVEAHPLNVPGRCEGVLRGGNLAVLAGLRGTAFDFPPEGTVLFVEDVNERPYQIDRMFTNLRLGGVLDRIAGLVVGRFTGGERDGEWQDEAYGAIARMMAGRGCPVCFGFPVGHVLCNSPLVCGATVSLSVDGGGARLLYEF